MRSAADPARLGAHSTLVEVLDRGQPLETALDAQLNLLGNARDRAFAHQLVLTVLRRRGALLQICERLLERPLAKKMLAVQTILELGLAQLFYLNVPDHAAVSSSLALSEQNKLHRHKALINAILRRAQRERAALAPIANSVDVIIPGWLRRRWTGQFGEQTVRSISEILVTEPPLDISVSGKAQEWAGRLGGRRLFGQTVRREATPVTALSGFGEGRWWVQDAAAAVPARLLPLPDTGPVLELCAAPGGKTAQLTAAGAKVIAVDRSTRRLQRLKENLARLNLSATIVEADAVSWRHSGPVESILVDAPCSATGTIRRRPDIPWTKSEEDIASLARLQARILENAVAQLNLGGALVYAVCSLEDEEGPKQIEQALEKHPELERMPVTKNELGPFAAARTAEGDVRILPCHLVEDGGVDGFYIARLKRLK